jgi:uncharacterized phiE125 gp8 family phage protein
MALSLVTPPADVAVTLADAKAQCRIDADQHDEDGLVDGLIQAATQHVESFTHRALITQTWDETFDGFPCGYDGEIWLSKPPVSAVSSLSYIDSAGATQVWASSNYTKDLPVRPVGASRAHRGRVQHPVSGDAGRHQRGNGAVRVRGMAPMGRTCRRRSRTR